LRLSCWTVHRPLLRKSAPAPFRKPNGLAALATAALDSASRAGMTRSNIDLAQCRCEATSHHAGPARHHGAKQAERTVVGRSTSIPVFGVLALLLATAARLPRTIGLRHRKSIRPRSIPDHRRDQRAQAGAADNQGPRGRIPTAGIGVVPADDAAATPTGVDGVVVARVRPGSRAERAGLRGANADSGGARRHHHRRQRRRRPQPVRPDASARTGRHRGGPSISPSGVTARLPTMAVDVADEPQRQ
jgi:hypothetical protein